jgi:transposase
MYEVSKCAPQEALRDLDKAFANFFRRVKQKKQGKLNGKVGFPRFKKRKNGLGSFRLTGSIHVFATRGHTWSLIAILSCLRKLLLRSMCDLSLKKASSCRVWEGCA